MAEDTSSAGSATPTADMPVTGNAPSGATPQAASLSLEAAMKRIADLEHSHKNATEEVERHRKKLSAYEKADKEAQAARQAAEDAKLGEVELAKKQHAELQARNEDLAAELLEMRVNSEVAKHASKLNFIVPADLVARMLDWSEIEYDEDSARPTNIDKLLDRLAKSAPDIVRSQPAKAETGQVRAPATPAIPAMNPGRANITAPNTLPPGKIPTLEDIYRRNRG